MPKQRTPHKAATGPVRLLEAAEMRQHVQPCPHLVMGGPSIGSPPHIRHIAADSPALFKLSNWLLRA